MDLKDVIKNAKKSKIIKQELASSQWTAAKIRNLINTNDIFIERALRVLLARQTDDEVRAESTNCNNNMGFTAADAKLLTSFAKQIKESTDKYPVGKRLSRSQFYWARKKLQKYARQLATYANSKEIVRAEQALGVNTNNKDFTKGGTYRKVDYGK